MPERFAYPPEAMQELERQSRRRLWFWLIFLSPFLAGGVHSVLSGDGLLGPLIALGALGMVAFFESRIRLFERRTRGLAG